MAPSSRRASSVRWAAPDPAALVLDPWAAPIGVGIADGSAAAWQPPVAHTRIRWMPAPAALLPPPAALAGAPTPAPPSAATERALATLRAISAAPTDVRELPPLRPLPPPTGASPLAAPVPTFASPDPAARVTADAPPLVRWRLIALVTAVGASVAATVTLLAALL